MVFKYASLLLVYVMGLFESVRNTKFSTVFEIYIWASVFIVHEAVLLDMVVVNFEKHTADGCGLKILVA